MRLKLNKSNIFVRDFTSKNYGYFYEKMASTPTVMDQIRTPNLTRWEINIMCPYVVCRQTDVQTIQIRISQMANIVNIQIDY